MKDFESRYRRRERMNRERYQRLLRKIQKARALAYIEEVLSPPSWGKRFGRTAKLRATT